MMFLPTFVSIIIFLIKIDFFCKCTWKQSLHNCAPPLDYDEYIIADKSSVDKCIRKWILYIDNTIYQIRKSLQKVKDISNIPIWYVNSFIIRLNESKKFLNKYFPRSLYPYINSTVLRTRMIFFKVVCNDLKRIIYELMTCSNRHSNNEMLLIEKIDKINRFLDKLAYELDEILLDTFVTIARDANKNRRIHCPKNEIIYNFVCVVCKGHIRVTDYIFAFLCGHQAHMGCWTGIYTIPNVCLECGKVFWDEIENDENGD